MAAADGFLTIGDLVAMPQLGLELVAGATGVERAVLWTHTSELEDPGPWLEGGELLIVNGFGIPDGPAEQSAYVRRLSEHRLSGIAVSVRSPPLTAALLAEADALGFPVLRIPRQIPFIELSYLVANASDRAARGRLARHLQIFETLRLRSEDGTGTASMYAQLEQLSGYRLSVVTQTGRALLDEWPRLPGLPTDALVDVRDVRVLDGAFVLPLRVGDRVTALLVGEEDDDLDAGGLSALQHVSTLAALDAVDDQRRREMQHREGGGVLASAFDGRAAVDELEERLSDFGVTAGFRVLAFGDRARDEDLDIDVRDWLADRAIAHLLLRRRTLFAIVAAEDDDLERLAAAQEVAIGASPPSFDLGDLARLRRQALWARGVAVESRAACTVLAEREVGLTRWLNPDAATLQELASEVLRPLRDHDEQHDSALVETLTAFFRNQGRRRATAAELFVHEHTLAYRLKRIEELSGRALRSYRDAFELWLAIDAVSVEE